ncbi:MAG: CvpA family protein [Clostridia bacterium]
MIFDIIIAIVIISFAAKYFHEGLVNSVILFFSKIIMFIAAFIVAGRYSTELSEKYILDKVSGYIDSIIVKNFNFNDVYSAFEDSISTSNSEIVEFLLELNGTDINRLMLAGSENAISIMRENVVTSIAYGFTYTVIFIATLILVSLAISFILSFLDLVFELPILGWINSISGALLGIITGLLVSSVVIWTIITVMPVTTMDDGIFNEQTIEDTYILKHICNATPDAIATFIY